MTFTEGTEGLPCLHSGVELEGYLIGQIQEETMLKYLLWGFVTVQNLNLLSLGISVSALKGKLGILKLQHGPKPF